MTKASTWLRKENETGQDKNRCICSVQIEIASAYEKSDITVWQTKTQLACRLFFNGLQLRDVCF